MTSPCPLSGKELGELPTRHGLPIEAVVGNLGVEGKVVSVTIALREGFPYTLPLVFMYPWDAFDVIPHVEADGYVCFAADEGLIVDPNRWEAVVSESVDKALNQIRRGATKQNFEDFADEFQPYWNRQKQIINGVQSLVAPTDEPKLIQAFVKGTEYVYVCDREADLVDYRSERPVKHLTQRNALYVPLPIGTVIVPPHPDRSWTSEEAIRTIFDCLDASTVEEIGKLTRKLTKYEELVVFHLPRTGGDGGTLFGLNYKGLQGMHPLAGGPSPEGVHPIRFDRCDRSFVLPRGGGYTEPHDSRIALIGCGSIGGFLALELARSGIGRFTLIDHDVLSAENIFRHVLGAKYLGKKKVVALKEYMQETVPYLRIATLDARVENAIADNTLDPSDFDAVVIALGYPPLELYLNKIATASKMISTPFVFVWVEAYGIGGHVMVRNNSKSGRIARGCLECLYTPLPDDKDTLHCRASFARAGQDFGRNISGCSGLFIPYGSTTAVRVAARATETIVDVLLGREEGSPLLSFKGSSLEFKEQGLKLTARYEKSSEDLYACRYDYANATCSVCGGNK